MQLSPKYIQWKKSWVKNGVYGKMRGKVIIFIFYCCYNKLPQAYNVNLWSHSSVHHSSVHQVSLVTIKVLAGLCSFLEVLENSVFLPCPSSRGHPHSLVGEPLPHIHSQQKRERSFSHCTSLTLVPSSHLSDHSSGRFSAFSD